jgi:MFS family permease
VASIGMSCTFVSLSINSWPFSWIWFVLANLLALAGVCPFVGSLSDLIGRRYVALIGAVFIMVGMVVCSTAHTMNVFIGRLSPSDPDAKANALNRRHDAGWHRRRY